MSTSDIMALSNKQEFILRRLHSLAGIVPIGVFLLEHLFTNMFLREHDPEAGFAAYASKIEFLWSLPYLVWIELLVLAVPIAFHSLYGLYITRTGRITAPDAKYGRNWTYLFQRWTGLFVILFLVLHLYFFRFGEFQYHYQPADFGPAVAKKMANTGWYVFYLVGVVVTTFHLCNGFWAAGITWGVTIGRKAQKASMVLFMGLFFLLSFLWVDVLIAARGKSDVYKDWKPPVAEEHDEAEGDSSLRSE